MALQHAKSKGKMRIDSRFAQALGEFLKFICPMKARSIMEYAKERIAMVDCQIRPEGVANPAIISAFKSVGRHIFVKKSRVPLAYAETEITTSEKRSLWTPSDTAKLLEAADPKSSDRTLVIGAGAGYEAALLSKLVQLVLALEEMPKETSRDLIAEMKTNFDSVNAKNAVAVGGKVNQGLPGRGPFDLIYVCGMVQVIPTKWFQQLSEHGRLAVVVEVERNLGRGRIYRRAGDYYSYVDMFDAKPPKFAEFDQTSQFQF